jgi:glycosyl transferase family 2
MSERPPLSVVIPARGGLHEVAPVLDALIPQAERTGGEVLIVGPVDGPPPSARVRVLRVPDNNMFRLRLAGVRAARGDVIAIGEDHAIPRTDWCEAVLRAHAEHPEAAVVVGALVNGTDRTVSGRGNFLSYAAPFSRPMPELPAERVPPVALISFKRSALDELEDTLGHFECVLMPRMYAEGQMVADDRVVIDHYQDHGAVWSILNGFHGARAGYGYVQPRLTLRERLKQARWSMTNLPRRSFENGRLGGDASGGPERGLVALIGLGNAAGAVVGALTGPGRSGERVA